MSGEGMKDDVEAASSSDGSEPADEAVSSNVAEDAEVADTEDTDSEASAAAESESLEVDNAALAGSRRGNHRRAGALIGVLLALLGFGIAVQVRSNSASDSLANASSEDLIRILDDQDSREDRLRQEIDALQTTEQQLQASGDRDSVALQQAQQQAQALGILLGTLPATGSGVTITITDPQRGLKAEDLLDVVEELRGAGAEAIQFGSVRVSAATAFLDQNGGSVAVDGRTVTAPYVVLAIGDPQTLDTAMQIPGGVAATARAAGGNAIVRELGAVDITATRVTTDPRYAKPTGK